MNRRSLLSRALGLLGIGAGVKPPAVETEEPATEWSGYIQNLGPVTDTGGTVWHRTSWTCTKPGPYSVFLNGDWSTDEPAPEVGRDAP